MTQEPHFPIPFGRYTLERKLARGGMAEIFLAKSRGAHGFERTVVIKRIHPEHAEEPKFVDWFIEEARLMMRLVHPKVVQVHDFGEVDGQYYLAMEYVKGIDGLELLRSCARRRWRPSHIIAAQIMADVLDALQYAHALKDDEGRPLNIVHCDVSPSNIFLSDLGEVKLSDFGIATMGGRRAGAETGYVRGKHGYLAPEVISGLPVDHRADIFSAGVVLAELVMVQRLFRGKNYLDVLMQVRDGNLERLDSFGQHIPQDLRQILEYALARDPYLRYQEAGAFRDALHRYLYDRQQLLRSTSIRRFMHRLTDPEATLPTPPPAMKAEEGHSSTSRPPGPAFLHGRRRILLGPPPEMVPPPLYPTREEQDTDRAAEEPIGPMSSTQEISLGGGDDFFSGESLPSAPVLPPLVVPLLADPQAPDDDPMAHLDSGVYRDLPRPVPSFRWNLAERSLVAILFELAVATETGLLVVRESSLVKELYLHEGDPLFVASNAREELFGQFLIGQGVLTEEELNRALAILPQYKGRLGETLVALRLLRPMQMLRLLTQQVRQKVLNAFRITDGYASYYRGITCDRAVAPLGLDAFELLEAGVSALDWPTLQARLTPAMDRRPRAVSPPPVPPELFRVGDYPRMVYDQLDGTMTLVEHLLGSPHEPDPGAFMRMVYLLVECGLVTLE